MFHGEEAIHHVFNFKIQVQEQSCVLQVSTADLSCQSDPLLKLRDLLSS